jgi:hypothetical protein
MAFAHASGLTHNALDLTQVLGNSDSSIFKITNFRPWVAQTRSYSEIEGLDLTY